MDYDVVRTRFAPSPTGYMHIGNLRTALYGYLFAKTHNGVYVLRIEDTDQKRYVAGATEIIYRSLKEAKIFHDEGPDKGGNYGPYIQSERRSLYQDYAKKLVELGHAYYCFCGKDEHDDHEEEGNEPSLSGYNRKCRNLSAETVKKNLESGMPYVIRQKMPLVGTTSFDDIVFGKVKVQNSTLEDQVLLKSDGLPTYNFANVIDDHLMAITHVLRGTEYIPSTPKYVLLYEAFGWEVPNFAHLPIIRGKDAQGNVAKLSKRFGATSFEDLVKEGYLPEAIVNYIVLLGWSPKSEREIFSIDELKTMFELTDVSKSPSIFDYKKLRWMNSVYLKALSDEKLGALLKPFATNLPKEMESKWNFIVKVNKERLERLSDIQTLLSDMLTRTEYEAELLTNEKNKVGYQEAKQNMLLAKEALEKETVWEHDHLHDVLLALVEQMGCKIGYFMWPVRIALTGRKTSPSATEYMFCLGKEETLARLTIALEKLENAQ